ncbi:hypothetical protein Gotri_008324 [Gossypium trilobum]|uniref:DUF4283 domain-containing protein n=1 Tax=Gossypium trilobum TaxID=34281 RepID=A0A7J9EJ14_9ROSI|nr:hypothetical protein [Gossypium trilobum]
MKSIWKTKKKFEIQSVGQNLFLIVFEKNLVILDRLTKLMERDQIRLVSSPFWIKIGMCLPEFDKKRPLACYRGHFWRRSQI